jgi:DnaK suppressor protein
MARLTPRQIEELRRRLLEARDVAIALLARGSRETRQVEVSGSSIGRLTRIDALQVQGMEQLSRHQLDIRRQQIEAALAAIEAGSYGSCRHCHGPISLQRLEALPEAPFCVECQESFEQGR